MQLLRITGNQLTPETLKFKQLSRRAALLAAQAGTQHPAIVRAARKFIEDVDAGKGGPRVPGFISKDATAVSRG